MHNAREKASAIPFITYDQKEGFCLNKDAEEYLMSLPDDRKLGVISVVGKYRTGKSFFVNRVLLDHQGGSNNSSTGFQVGPTINPCTKGLWLWKKELKSSEDSNMDILLIDTEGFGGMDENATHDSRIFLFSLLLSSYFIYNSQGSIDENALNSLSLIVNLAKDIQVNATVTAAAVGGGGVTSQQLPLNNRDIEKEDAANHFPSFLWVVRDFSLQIVDQIGNTISQREYLEKALELQKGVSDAIESKNRIRKLMKHFFKERDCCTLVRPVESEKELQNLNNMANEDLRPEFNEEVAVLRRKIFKRVKPKTLWGRPLNGRMLVDICKAYTLAINKGSIPNIESAWTYVKKNESQKAFAKSLETLEEHIVLATKQGPIDPTKIDSFRATMKKKMIDVLKRNSMCDGADLIDFYKLIEDKVTERVREFKKQNKLSLKSKYSSLIQKRVQDLQVKLNNEEYSDFISFSDAMAELKRDFESQTPPRDQLAANYLTEVSAKLYELAAEKIGSRKDREQQKLVRLAETRLTMRENELAFKQAEMQRERSNNEDRISKLLKELAGLRAAEQMREQKLAQLTREYDMLSHAHREQSTQVSDAQQNRERESTIRIKELEVALELTKNNHIQQDANAEKTIALLEQEKVFMLRESELMREKLLSLETENKQTKIENTTQLSTIHRLKEEFGEATAANNKELGQVKLEFDRKVSEITSEHDSKNQILKQHSDFLIEKTYLENQVAFYKNQLDENKKIHDTLLVALSSNTSNNVNSNAAASESVADINSSRLSKQSSISNCLSSHNNNNTSNTHISQISNNLSATATAPASGVAIIAKQVLGLDPTQLIIAINQTMVRESPDKKPFTEYLIQVNYSNMKWEVARKYKNFCELHSQLSTMFPSVRMPDSSCAIINSSTDINNIISAKRPTVIEDRRKALQSYIRDLAKIDVLRNAVPYKQFLEIDQNIEFKSTNQFTQGQQSLVASTNSVSLTEDRCMSAMPTLNSKQQMLLAKQNQSRYQQQSQKQQQQQQFQLEYQPQPLQLQSQQQQQQQQLYMDRHNVPQFELQLDSSCMSQQQGKANLMYSSNRQENRVPSTTQSPQSFLKSLNKENHPRSVSAIGQSNSGKLEGAGGQFMSGISAFNRYDSKGSSAANALAQNYQTQMHHRTRTDLQKRSFNQFTRMLPLIKMTQNPTKKANDLSSDNP